MALVKTEAVVLKSNNYREKSKILTLYTESFGKIRVIAKGVRDTRSKWGGALQSMAYLRVIFYLHENRTLHLLSTAEYVNAFQSLQGDYEKMKAGFRIVEMVNRMTMENHVISGLFDLLVSSLDALDNATKNSFNVLFYFEFKLARLLGIAIEPGVFDRTIEIRQHRSAAARKGNKRSSSNLNPADGRSVTYTGKSAELLRTVSSLSLEDMLKLDLTGASVKIVDNFLDMYFREHFETPGYSKAKKVFDSKEFYVK
jgi:DNA repair protein RecO (recombination protein O)